MSKLPGRRGEVRARGRRLAGAVVASLLAIGSSVFFAPVAHAATKTITTSQNLEAWYWLSNQSVGACTPALPPQLGVPGVCQSENAGPAAPISPGHLGIAAKAGQPDMRAYILFDLSFIPTGSKLNSMVLTFTVSSVDPSNTQHTQEHAVDPTAVAGGSADTQPKPPATSDPANAAAIDACLLTIGFGNAEGDPPNGIDPTKSDDPRQNAVPNDPWIRGGVDTNSCVHGKGSATAWTFDITPIAQQWIAGTTFNNGVALVPVINNGDPTANWTIELHGAYYTELVSDAQGNLSQKVFVAHNEEATAKVDYIPAVTPAIVPPPPVVVPPAPALGGPPSVVTLPSAPLPTPVPSVGVTQPQPVARSNPKTPWYVWLVLPAGIICFVALSRALGREAGEDSFNRVAEVLRRRRAETAGA